MSENEVRSDQLSESGLRIVGMQLLPTKIQAEITLKEALKGAKRNFKVTDHFACEKCSRQKIVSRMKCEACKGLGYKQVDRFVDVELPANLCENEEIRFPELGRHDMRLDKNADLIVKISITEHETLKVSGNDITCSVTVSLYDAVLGAEVKVPTAKGNVMMKIQPLTSSGKIYRLRGLGIGGGDQLVTIEVAMPERLSDEQVLLFRKLRELQDSPVSTNNSLVFIG